MERASLSHGHLGEGRFDGKVAIVTGGARGMGAAHAAAFVHEGGSVVVGDVLVDEGSRLAAELGAAAAFVPLDVASPDDWQQVVSTAVGLFGGVDILVNNAGIVGPRLPISSISVEQYQRVIEVNQIGVFLGMRAVVPAMAKGSGGSIVNVSSVAGHVGAALTVAYTASKFAVRGMSKVAALELGNLGIRVNTVSPGIIQTPMNEDDPAWQSIKSAAGGIASQRVAQPSEVTAAVLFLASDAASYCTGADIVVDGGMTAGLYSKQAADAASSSAVLRA